MKDYNITQLNPDTCFERHVYHRDQFAHYLRWTHVLKLAKIGMKILDFGCGSGNLAEVLYRNKFKANKYLGVDIRKQTITNANIKFENVDWVKFETHDLCSNALQLQNDWDIICSFEVIEHIGKNNADQFLTNIKNCCNENTTVLLSTPNYDEHVGAASNHIINGNVCEFGFNELKEKLQKYFVIENAFGTFASQKDYKELLQNDEHIKHIFERAHQYYDSNLLSNFMAPLIHPEHARNVMWVLKRK